jgi:colicin import membrane protein
MDELRESSLLFSLESLLETERERVQRETREAQERREQELKRVAELAERRRSAAQQERDARQRRQALEQERERLDHERIEAMKQATVERARIEAESRARLVEMDQARQHDLALSRLREHAGTARYRTLFWLSSGGLVTTLVLGLVGVFGFERPAHAHEQARSRSLLSATETRLTATERALSAERSKSDALEERLKQLQTAAVSAPAAKPPKIEGQAGPRLPHVLGPPKRGTCKDDGDPINGCMP